MNTDSSQMLYPDFTHSMQPFPINGSLPPGVPGGPMHQTTGGDYFDIGETYNKKVKVGRSK